MVLGKERGRLDLMRGGQRHSILSRLKRGTQARVPSDQKVLMMARWGRLDLVRDNQRRSRESWKRTLGSKGTKLKKNWHSDSLKRFNLLFLRVRCRREMMLLMMKMMMW
jgi:hypothetical protein